MDDNEKEFKKFINEIKLDDGPDLKHRDKLEQDLLNALAKQERLEPSPLMHEKLKTWMRTYGSIWARYFTNPFARKVVFRFAEVAAIVALTLSVSHWFGYPRSRVPGELVPEIQDDSATINLYLKEHQDVVARHVYHSAAIPQPTQMRVGRHDILYYELFGDPYEFARPGIIVRGPSSEQPISPSEDPAISNGHTLTLSQARKTTDFDLVAPPRLYPGYMLDQIRSIEGRDAVHLLYTDGINTVSLFEQPLDGQRGLGPQDFREYAVYCNKGRVGGAILAWRDEALSYVLIGNVEMSQLMDMAQPISAVNERE